MECSHNFAPSAERETRENPLGVLHIDVARLGINRRAGCGVAQINRVAQKIGVKALPQFFARLRVEARHALVQVRPLAQIAHDVKFALSDHRGGHAGKVGRP
jgi:hypothetical protein